VIRSLVAMLVGVGVGAAAFALLAESQLGDEVSALGAKVGVPAGSGGGGKLLSLVDVVSPGASDRIKTAAIATAVGGAVAAVLTYAIVNEVLS
jgi:hypothetical protein